MCGGGGVGLGGAGVGGWWWWWWWVVVVGSYVRSQISFIITLIIDAYCEFLVKVTKGSFGKIPLKSVVGTIGYFVEGPTS